MKSIFNKLWTRGRGVGGCDDPSAPWGLVKSIDMFKKEVHLKTWIKIKYDIDSVCLGFSNFYQVTEYKM